MIRTQLPDTLDAAGEFLNAEGWSWKLRVRPMPGGLPREIQYTATVWRLEGRGARSSRKHTGSTAVGALEDALADAETSPVNARAYPPRSRRTA